MDEQQRAYYRTLYEKLAAKYTPEELVEAFVFPPDVDEETQGKEAAQLAAWRKQRLQNRTPQERLLADLMRLRFEIEADLNQPLPKARTLSHYLRAYLRLTSQAQRELAADLDLAPARLSRILNGKERLSLALAYRLERHSGDLVPALLWWKLVQQEIEREIAADPPEKFREQQRVKRVLYQG